jgi:hypothetical protein
VKNYTFFGEITFFSLCVFLLFTRTAHAYIDPGTGSYILQIIIAAILAFFFSIKMFWFKIRHFLRNLFKKRE